jgi:hypothetical protein
MLGNTATEVIDGSKYVATVSAINGYKILSVTVNMGGNDITSTAYSDGVITIDSVTGNIVITVTTEALPDTPEGPSYNNLADPTSAEWMDNYRITSTGVVEKRDGVTLVNTIPCVKGDTIRVKGMTNVIVAQYKNGVFHARITVTANSDQFGSPVVNGDYSQFTIAYEGVTSIRFYGNLSGTATDVIITKNEPIE